ncbi:FUBP3 [Scenedesmus sp. PABB004]|nr:FUBP3 [Scenedesmus sp. PABB004]
MDGGPPLTAMDSGSGSAADDAGGDSLARLDGASLLAVLRRLAPPELAALACCCHALRAAASAGVVWAPILAARFDLSPSLSGDPGQAVDWPGAARRLAAALRAPHAQRFAALYTDGGCDGAPTDLTYWADNAWQPNFASPFCTDASADANILAVLQLDGMGVDAALAAQRDYLVQRCAPAAALLFAPPGAPPGSHAQLLADARAQLASWSSLGLERLFLDLHQDLALHQESWGRLLLAGVPPEEVQAEVARLAAAAEAITSRQGRGRYRAVRQVPPAALEAAGGAPAAGERGDGDGEPPARKPSHHLVDTQLLPWLSAPGAVTTTALVSEVVVSRVGHFTCPVAAGALLLGQHSQALPPGRADDWASGPQLAAVLATRADPIVAALDGASSLAAVQAAVAAGRLPPLLKHVQSAGAEWAEFVPLPAEQREARRRQGWCLRPVLWFRFWTPPAAPPAVMPDFAEGQQHLQAEQAEQADGASTASESGSDDDPEHLPDAAQDGASASGDASSARGGGGSPCAAGGGGSPRGGGGGSGSGSGGGGGGGGSGEQLFALAPPPPALHEVAPGSAPMPPHLLLRAALSRVRSGNVAVLKLIDAEDRMQEYGDVAETPNIDIQFVALRGAGLRVTAPGVALHARWSLLPLPSTRCVTWAMAEQHADGSQSPSVAFALSGSSADGKAPPHAEQAAEASDAAGREEAPSDGPAGGTDRAAPAAKRGRRELNDGPDAAELLPPHPKRRPSAVAGEQRQQQQQVDDAVPPAGDDDEPPDERDAAEQQQEGEQQAAAQTRGPGGSGAAAAGDAGAGEQREAPGGSPRTVQDGAEHASERAPPARARARAAPPARRAAARTRAGMRAQQRAPAPAGATTPSPGPPPPAAPGSPSDGAAPGGAAAAPRARSPPRRATGARGGGPGVRADFPLLTHEDGSVTATLAVSRHLVGKLIGKAGATIGALQAGSGTSIQVDQEGAELGSDARQVTVRGGADAVSRAVEAIQSALEEAVPPGEGEVERRLPCPASFVGRIIGRGGETIRSLQAASGAHILVDQNFPEGHDRAVIITGPAEGVDRAAQMIEELIHGEPGTASQIICKARALRTPRRAALRRGVSRPPSARRAAPPARAPTRGRAAGPAPQHSLGHTLVMSCPRAVVGRVIGKGGETVKGLQRRYGVSIQIDQSSDPMSVTITGPQPAAEACQLEVTALMNDTPFAGPHGVFGPPGAFGRPGGGGFAPYGMPPGFAPYGPFAGFVAPGGAFPGAMAGMAGAMMPGGGGGAPGGGFAAQQAGGGSGGWGGSSGPASGGAGGYGGGAMQQQQQQMQQMQQLMQQQMQQQMQQLYGMQAGGYGMMGGGGMMPGGASMMGGGAGMMGGPGPGGGRAGGAGAASAWEAVLDDQGRTFYWNSLTNRSQWNKPGEME